MPTVHLRYWAGARAAAGCAEEAVEAATVGEALALVTAAHADERFSRVVRACSVLVDGVAAHEADLARALVVPVEVELLPPFAGGAVDVDPVGSPGGHRTEVCRTSRVGVSGCGTRVEARPPSRMVDSRPAE